MRTPAERVVLPESLQRRWIDACRRQLPDEACGVVCGRFTGSAVVVDDFVFIRNAAADKTTAFRFDAADWIRVWYAVQRRNGTIVGIFHTHPDGDTNPSEADQLGQPGWGTYWIVGLDKQKSRIAVYVPDPESGWQTLRLQTIMDGP